MFLKKITDLRSSLAAKLTFWYSVVFSISSMIVLVIFYQQIVSVTLERTDEELHEELNEFADILKENGLGGLKEEVALESVAEDEEHIFIQVMSRTGEIITSSDTQTWGRLETTAGDLQALSDAQSPLFRTLTIRSKKYKARTVLGPIGPETIMHIGLSLEDKEEYLEIFRRLILILLLPVFGLATIMGWVMAKQALGGVDEVARTAEKITRGNYQERVCVRKGSREIDRLVAAFNQMVDKLHALIRGMREITDNIAHDLRSPLTRIRGIAEMNLMGDKTIDAFKEMAVSTVEECDNLIHMINTMLDITETEAGVGEKLIESVDMNQLILEACDLFSHIATAKKIKLTTHLPPSVVIDTDRAKIQRMVTNLLENAIKYTPPEGEVTISLTSKNNELHLNIKDTGMGIPPSDLPKIFDRFFRCDTSRSEHGVGLGLSLAKAIAEAFGGSINVNSVMNEGSEFIVIMPA